MAPGSFKCPKCERSFSMAAHLARHTNTIHGARRGPKPMARRGPGRPRKRRVGRPRGSKSHARAATGDGATQLLGQMQSYYSELTARRASLEAQIAGMESAMNVMGAVPMARAAGRKRGRPVGSVSGARAGSLKDTIVRVLRQRSKALSPKEIAAGVMKAGYRTSTKNLTKAVSNTLPDMSGIRKVGRGLYQA